MVSEKQLAANRSNALKSTGPRTEAGKVRSARNSLKHGLLAKEVVITAGEGAEDQQVFDALLSDFIEQYAPDGPLEEMLVEKIAVCYWRLRRANRHEVGLLRRELDNVSDKFYSDGIMSYSGTKRTDEDIDFEIEECQEAVECCKKSRRNLHNLMQSGQPLSEFYDDDTWLTLARNLTDKGRIIEINVESSQTIHQNLRKENWTDDQIAKELMSFCNININCLQSRINRLQKEKADNALALQVRKKINCLPSAKNVDRLLRYETAIDRQLFKAINQLERLQRHRQGDQVPPPIELDVNLNTENNQ